MGLHGGQTTPQRASVPAYVLSFNFEIKMFSGKEEHEAAFLFFQAYKWYELGHKRGHFASVWQRSLYNVNGLKAQPWWTPRETGYTELVKVSISFHSSPSNLPPAETTGVEGMVAKRYFISSKRIF